MKNIAKIKNPTNKLVTKINKLKNELVSYTQKNELTKNLKIIYIWVCIYIYVCVTYIYMSTQLVDSRIPINREKMCTSKI